ncbi:2OG-Fe(II) oxygenase [Streptomyces sp. NPDC093249]|uniref:2OG-Fe(II) oxygenase n=1 Tax=unclassified Streptomyces TaxID=2593676 RepID=UPI00344D6D21
MTGSTTTTTHPVYACEQFAVHDDVLPAAEFDLLWRHLQSVRYKQVDPGRPGSPWLVENRLPLAGPGLTLPSHEYGSERAGAASPLHRLTARITALAAEARPLLGTPGTDWRTCSATPYLYGAGAGLAWHTDYAYAGTYIFYAHPRWEAHWGGELIVADASCRIPYCPPGQIDPDSTAERLASPLDRGAMSRHLLGPGIGRTVLPKPNRLVLLQGGHPHRITRVDPAAGDHMRASVAGFFSTEAAL